MARIILKNNRKNSLPLPEYVVDPDSCKLIKPMQINPSELADRIKLLRNSPQMLVEYTENLHNNIISNFSIEKYATRLNNIYLDVIESVSALKSL